MSSNLPRPRPGIMEIAPYVPGKSQLPGKGPIIKLSSNETPFGPSPKAIAAHEKAKAYVAQVVRLGIVRMPGHHRGRRPAIRHSRRKLVDAITTGRVAHQINTVRVYTASRHVILDQAIKQTVDVRLMPQVPRVSRRARRDVNSLGRLVELNLVFPLAVVHLGRRTAAAVHRDPQ